MILGQLANRCTFSESLLSELFIALASPLGGAVGESGLAVERLKLIVLLCQVIIISTHFPHELFLPLQEILCSLTFWLSKQ